MARRLARPIIPHGQRLVQVTVQCLYKILAPQPPTPASFPQVPKEASKEAPPVEQATRTVLDEPALDDPMLDEQVVEQVEELDEHKEGVLESEEAEEPPRKKSRLQAILSNKLARPDTKMDDDELDEDELYEDELYEDELEEDQSEPSLDTERSETTTAPAAGPAVSKPTRLGRSCYANRQKDLLRAWLCQNLGDHCPTAAALEPVAKAAGLTTKQVRPWIKKFYDLNPRPTLEQAMAWRNGDYDTLNKWFMAHRENPYPSNEDKQRLAQETGRTLKQVDKWFKKALHDRGVAGHNLNYRPDQIALLRASSEEDSFPTNNKKERLAGAIGLSIKQVDM